MKLAHPETEWSSGRNFECFSNSQHSSGVTTSIDLLKVFSPFEERNTETTISFTENLGDMDILRLIDSDTFELFSFIKAREDDKRHPTLKGVRVSQSILIALQDHFKLSPIFMNSITSPRFSPSYTTYYIDRDECGREASLHGFYFYRSMIIGQQMGIHYRYDLANGVVVYFIVHCPDVLVQIFRQTIKKTQMCYDRSLLLQPFCVDLFIANFLVWTDLTKFNKRSDMILQMQRSPKIHDEARMLTTSITQLIEFGFQFKYIRRMAKIFQKLIHVKSKAERARICSETALVMESLEHLECRIQMALNWLKNFQKRLDIRINLAFNLRAQKDSQTNLKIAKLTTEIAVDAQRDSSSMITIAAVTMFFLPGTFICAVFSMVFFNDGIAPNGSDVFTVSRKWWYFLVATIPLTIARKLLH
ncbi:hypothetical protein BDQ17DRAFT_1362203 [Cyathus striatus]|nr:hypothetical protein BDQ17DRAFT_1362203 [Cyathus striatus]